MARGKHGRTAELRRQREAEAAEAASTKAQADLRRRLNDARARQAEAEKALLGASEILALANEMDRSRVDAVRAAERAEVGASEMRSQLRRVGRAWERDWNEWLFHQTRGGVDEEAMEGIDGLVTLRLSPMNADERRVVQHKLRERAGLPDKREEIRQQVMERARRATEDRANRDADGGTRSEPTKWAEQGSTPGVELTQHGEVASTE